MGLFSNKKEGGLMDVIRCDEPDYLVWKWRPKGQEVNSTRRENAIRYGSSLRVKDGELAVFFYKQGDDVMQDFIVGPYDSTIKSANFPVLASIVGMAFGGESPFQAEIYYINLQGNNQIRFAVPYFDIADPRYPDFTVPVSVRGVITFTLTDYKRFIKLNRLVDFDLDAFNNQVKGAVIKYAKSFVGRCPLENSIPVLQMETRTLEISDLMHSSLASIFENDFGVTLKRLDISAIEIDRTSENYESFVRLTKEQHMRRAEIDTEQYERVAKLSAESQFIQAHAVNKQAEVLSTAAESMGKWNTVNLGSDNGLGGMNPATMMMGMAVGGAMGNQMSGMINNSMNPIQQQYPKIQAPPPPIPNTKSYMVAINGAQYGPYSIQQMQQMAQSGHIDGNVLTWCAGMPNWAPAATIPELATLFVVAPPPLP